MINFKNLRRETQERTYCGGSPMTKQRPLINIIKGLVRKARLPRFFNRKGPRWHPTWQVLLCYAVLLLAYDFLASCRQVHERVLRSRPALDVLAKGYREMAFVGVACATARQRRRRSMRDRGHRWHIVFAKQPEPAFLHENTRWPNQQTCTRDRSCRRETSKIPLVARSRQPARRNATSHT